LSECLPAEGIVAYFGHEVHLTGRSEAGRSDGLISSFATVVLRKGAAQNGFARCGQPGAANDQIGVVATNHENRHEEASKDYQSNSGRRVLNDAML
jgi:hypothetical protein